jgi:predicted transcriptional regulator
MLCRIAAVIAAVFLFAAPAHAQKKPGLGEFPFWSAPKMPHAPAFVPGLQAALELTPEQIEKISEARLATVDSEEIRALKTKGDPNATKEELAAAAAKRAEAMEKLHKQVADILTPTQKALIQAINDAYATVIAEVADDYKDKLVAAKGDAEETAKLKKEQREAVAAAFAKKLDSVLSEKQRELVKKATEEQAKRGGNKVKPKK